MASHSYWRVHITAIQGGAYGPNARLAEVTMYDSSGTSLCSGGTAIASSSYPTTPAANAFDGDIISYWSNNGGPLPVWIGYHFASPVDVATVNLLIAPSWGPDAYPAAFTIDYSDDGASWTTAATFTSSNGGDFSHSACWSFAVAAPPTGAWSSYRINASGLVNPDGTGNIFIAELQLYDGGPNLAVPPYGVSGSWPGNATYANPGMDEFGGNQGSDNAFDGNLATWWNSGGHPPGWLSYNFQIPTAITSFCIYARIVGGVPTGAPTPVTLEASNDGGETWTVLGTYTLTWGTSAGNSPQCESLVSPLTLTCPSSSASVGVPYSSPFVATGGTMPYTFSIVAGALPPGLTLDPSTGLVSGTPTTSGSYSYTGQVTDADGFTKQATCSISSISLACPSGVAVVGRSYFDFLRVSGGVPPYTFSIISGSLPPGLTLDTLTGTISGTPTTSGTYPYTAQVVDANGLTATTSCSISISNCGSVGITGGQVVR